MEFFCETIVYNNRLYFIRIFIAFLCPIIIIQNFMQIRRKINSNSTDQLFELARLVGDLDGRPVQRPVHLDQLLLLLDNGVSGAWGCCWGRLLFQRAGDFGLGTNL
jgi:hypothetical protein